MSNEKYFKSIGPISIQKQGRSGVVYSFRREGVATPVSNQMDHPVFTNDPSLVETLANGKPLRALPSVKKQPLSRLGVNEVMTNAERDKAYKTRPSTAGVATPVLDQPPTTTTKKTTKKTKKNSK